MSGLKYDSEKPRLDLVDPWAIEGLAKVLTFGAKKYDAHNWRKGITFSRLLSALERHLIAVKKGIDIDEESGLPHIDHLGCCWMFLSYFMKTIDQTGLDDRFVNNWEEDPSKPLWDTYDPKQDKVPEETRQAIIQKWKEDCQNSRNGYGQ